MGMRTAASQAATAASVRPCPSLPMTRHTPPGKSVPTSSSGREWYSAAAFGFDGVLLGPGCAAPFAPKTLRASMGAAGRLPVLTVPDLPAALTALRGRGVTCLAAALYHSRPLDEVGTDFPGGLCLVIGSEGQGLTDAAVAACDAAVRIPMTELVESLTAGVAGSVLLWQFRGV